VYVRGWTPTGSNTLVVHDVVRAIAETCKRYNVTRILSDSYGASWVKEAFAVHGIDLLVRGFSGPEKVRRAGGLREALASHRLQLLDHEIQKRELLAYEERRTTNGKVSVDKPKRKGSSDDFIDSLALVVDEMLSCEPVLHVPAGLADYRLRDQLYVGNKRPKANWSHGPQYANVTPERIAALGDGTKWLVDNFTRSPVSLLMSIGEIANKLVVDPRAVLNLYGRDVVLQHSWLRWCLGSAAKMHPPDGFAYITTEPQDFCLLPAWPALRRQILEAGTVCAVVKFRTVRSPEEGLRPWHGGRRVHMSGFSPGAWPWDFFETPTTCGAAPACPPWTAPPAGCFLPDHRYYNWPEAYWSSSIEDIFAEGNAEKERHARRLAALNGQPATDENTTGAEPHVFRRGM
jgi:hypothetical protein